MQLILAAALVLLNSSAFAAEEFKPAYTADRKITDDSLADEDYQFRHLVDAQTTRKELALAKAKSEILKGELERAKVLVGGPSFSKEALAYKTWEFRESVSEIVRLEASVEFHIALANVYKLRVEKGSSLSNADLKIETGHRIRGYQAKLAAAASLLETVRYLKSITAAKELSGRTLLRNGSITPADAEKRQYYAVGAREQEEILVEQIDTLNKMISSLKKTQDRL